MTRDEIISELNRLEPWFHCIDLGDGLATKTRSAIGEPVDHPRPTWEIVKACVPEDLSGKTVLDVGCNAGFYSIKMKERGAARVLGIDAQRELIRQAVFVAKVKGLEIDYQRMSVYDLDPRELGQFDVTLALGLIYHCKHLVLALEKLFLITRELLVLETAIYPPELGLIYHCKHLVLALKKLFLVTRELLVLQTAIYPPEKGTRPTLHPIAYVENLPDAKEAVFNWFLPSTAALTALLKNVGFDEVSVLPTGVQTDRAVMVCRKRAPYPDSRAIAYLGSKRTLVDGPSRCHPGEVLTFRIRAENTGYARWLRGSEKGTEPGDVHLVAHLLTANEEPISLYHAGAFLPHDVAPGETVDVKISLRAPDSAGNYLLTFDMVSEHLAWFEDLGSMALKHELIVEG